MKRVMDAAFVPIIVLAYLVRAYWPVWLGFAAIVLIASVTFCSDAKAEGGTSHWFATDPILRQCCSQADCLPIRVTFDGANWTFPNPHTGATVAIPAGQTFPSRSDPQSFWACFNDYLPGHPLRTVYVAGAERPCFFAPEAGI